jgi:hypothetical protein
MDKQNDKVIPTLDDVISVGDPELAQLGDINALEDDFDDDFNDAAIRLDTSDSDIDSHNDDSFEDEFDNIALDPDVEQADTEPDEIKIELFDSEIEADSNLSANSEDFDQSITDIIVAERFPANESEPPAETPVPEVQEIPATDQDQSVSSNATETVETQTTETAAPEVALSPDTTPAINTEIMISEIVDEITHQLLPEIEWKIRTRVRDILDQRLTDDK